MAMQKAKRSRQPDKRPSHKSRVPGPVLAPTRRVNGKCNPRAVQKRHERQETAAAHDLKASLKEAQTKVARLQSDGAQKDALIATLRFQMQTMATEAETCNRLRISATGRAESEVAQIKKDVRSVCCSSCWTKFVRLMERYK